MAGRKLLYNETTPNEIWSFIHKGKSNPCGCGSNCFHKEYDGKRILYVCNACNQHLYEVVEKKEIEKELQEGTWKCKEEMKKFVILSEKDFSRIAAESTHIANNVLLARDCENDEKAMKEIIKSIGQHVSALQSVLLKEDY